MPLKCFVVCFLFVITTSVFAQRRSADIGLFAGGGTPIGDLNKQKLLSSIKPNVGAYYRYNFSSRWGIRFNAIYGAVGTTGSVDGIPWSFNKNVFQIESSIEINYLHFLLGHERMRFSPFVAYGIGAMVYPGSINNSLKITPTVPVTVGAKYALSKNLGIGAEFSIRKTFADDLDNWDNKQNFLLGLPKMNDGWHNNDWVCYYGVSVWYKVFWGKRPCPAYGNK